MANEIVNNTVSDDKKEKDKHVVKMWTPYKIKLDENYKFIPDNKAYIALLSGLKSIAMGILSAMDKMIYGLQIEGRENIKGFEDKGFVSVCNHVNFLDCTFIMLALKRKDISMTVLKSNMEIPFVRLFVKGSGALPIPKDPKAKENFKKAIDTLIQTGHIVHFYPEAVLMPNYNGVREFHKGAFVYAVKNNAPIVPLIVTYHKPKSKLRKSPTATIHILPPEYADKSLDEAEQILELRQRVHASMKNKFDSTDCLRDNTAVLAKYEK